MALKNRAYSVSTLEGKSKALKQIAGKVDLENPKAVIGYILNRDCSNASKLVLSQAYTNYCELHGIEYDEPKFQRQR